MSEMTNSQRSLPHATSASIPSGIHVDILLDTHASIHTHVNVHTHVCTTHIHKEKKEKKQIRCLAQGLLHTPCLCCSTQFTKCKVRGALPSRTCPGGWSKQTWPAVSYCLSWLPSPLLLPTTALSQEHRCCPRQGTVRQKASRVWAIGF